MIKRIKVHNFLRLQDIDLELGARNVLIGPNTTTPRECILQSRSRLPCRAGNRILKEFQALDQIGLPDMRRAFGPYRFALTPVIIVQMLEA